MGQILASTKRKWVGRRADSQYARDITKRLGIHPTIARILVARYGEIDEDWYELHVNGNRNELFNPSLLHDADKAVKRIRQAIESQEHIRIVGDFDVDGVAASTIMIRTLSVLGAKVTYHIPSRFHEGYGLSVEAVERAVEDNVGLLITVDNGISAYDAANRAKELSLPIIVTDHHNIGSILPQAYAIVHPRFPRNYCPEHELCGAAVCLKIAHALIGELPGELLQLAALATVCDQMPLRGENRIIVKEGLYEMQRRPIIGLKALIEVSGIGTQRLNAGHLGFQIGPRINSAGRLSEASRAVELFLTDDETEATLIAQELDDLNRFRKRLQQRMEDEALLQIAGNLSWLEEKTLVIDGQGFHEGLVGIVAGRIAERFNKPTLCLTNVHDGAKGSGRSIEGFDLFRALEDIQAKQRIFTRMGGHAAAAGFSLNSEDVEKLRKAFQTAGQEWWHDEIPEAHHKVDAKLRLRDVNLKFLDALRDLEPFGRDNPEPILYVPNVRVVWADTMGQGNQHLRIRVSDDTGCSQTVLAFGYGQTIDEWYVGSEHELLVTVQENIWNAERRIQLRLVDHR
ncbi:single-stranded-DNA-specific exonuclease RecJ [Alicyclobacillus acidoterrestris]|uniref:Single-stranded-DNA-specific exonuclease RecJ n=1 Tax=Alicyclobacillus acidoterrestris (strain ATCC 49025 / DSM 3922 / CIP 106132 / NCIMB 13137 / GD3B) TaxID=1356854 RepID=T0BTL2_ALIAG|nr:single-stranded-DNA-specific exonuclease RecJ [Alicyclobacillus acidoterrestris]EPZ43810.1 hypothetical protein N007_12210 [Alicyclobacillus acidoterrestris ATCC 49025]UNO51001.1 single-stranded-DNA-specific exonuclease RecJ [Alicyclobacillus acidoterrestris]GEO27933.1 hypothetical protein AAC03nite_37180 [Alicyclobacillus acidoterrestris]